MSVIDFSRAGVARREPFVQALMELKGCETKTRLASTLRKLLPPIVSQIPRRSSRVSSRTKKEIKVPLFGSRLTVRATWNPFNGIVLTEPEDSRARINGFFRVAGKILVHCLMGMSRSATLSIGFLMLRRGMTVEQALTQVRQHRGVRPNNGFLSQLIELDNRIRSEQAL